MDHSEGTGAGAGKVAMMVVATLVAMVVVVVMVVIENLVSGPMARLALGRWKWWWQ